MCRKGFEGIEMAFVFDIDTRPRLCRSPLWLVRYHLLELQRSPCKSKCLLAVLGGWLSRKTVLQICPRKIRFTPSFTWVHFGDVWLFFSRHHPFPLSPLFFAIVRTLIFTMRLSVFSISFSVLFEEFCILKKNSRDLEKWGQNRWQFSAEKKDIKIHSVWKLSLKVSSLRAKRAMYTPINK